MNSRRAILAALALVAVIMVVPLAQDPVYAADGDVQHDVVNQDDIHIRVPGSDSGAVEIAVGNGGSQTFSVYVYNDSQNYLLLTASGSSDSSHVSVDVDVGTELLQPSSASGTDHISIVQVTVSVDRYDDSPSETASLVLTFKDMVYDDPSFQVTVPIQITVDSAYYSADGNNKFLGFIPNNLDGALGSEWFTAVVTLIAWMVIAYIACLVVIPLFTRLFARRTPDDERRRTKKTLTSLIVVLIAVLSINQCLTILGAGPEIRDGFSTLSGVLYIAIGAIMAWTIYVFVVSALVKGMERGSDSAVDASLIPLFKMLGKIVIAVVAVASILAIFGVDLNGILVSAGVVTLGITLGAQNILNQFFSGIVLLSTRPFKKGDFVKIGGEVYIVRKVKLMFTEFDNWDQDQVVTIPNNVVSGGTIVNMTAEDKEARIYVYFNVAAGTDLELAQRLMVQAATEHPHVINDGSRSGPSARVNNVMNNGSELRLAAYVDDFDSGSSYGAQMRERILQLFAENGISAPINSMDVLVKGGTDGTASS